MVSSPLATAFVGMSVAMCAIVSLSIVDQSGAKSSVQAPPLDAAATAQMVLVAAAAMVAFNSGVAIIYVRLYNAAASGAVMNRWILQVIYFILCSSVSVLQLLLFPQPAGAMDGFVVVARVFLPAFATATYFLSMILVYAHLRTGGEGGAAGAGNMPITNSVKLLGKATLAAALATVALIFAAAIPAFYTE